MIGVDRADLDELLRKSRFTESQIVAILKEGEAGVALSELTRKHGASSRRTRLMRNQLVVAFRRLWELAPLWVRYSWLGHLVGSTQTYLVREFKVNPTEIQRQRPCDEATFEQIRQAQEQTRQMRASGELRSPRVWKTVAFELGGSVERAVVPTRASITPARIVECPACQVRLLESHACPMRPLDERDMRALANATKGRAQKTWADLSGWDRE